MVPYNYKQRQRVNIFYFMFNVTYIKYFVGKKMNGTLFYAKILEHYFIKLLTENISMFNVTYLKYYVGKNEWNFILC